LHGEHVLRSLMLSLASNENLCNFISHRGLSTGFARRFVAGDSLDDAIRVIRGLNRSGMMASLDYLGESVRDAQEARDAVHHYLQTLDAIRDTEIQCNISVKLTQLGLDIDESIAEDNMHKIVGRAQQLRNFVRIDMESSAYTERTLQMFKRLHREFGNSVGPVIQSYLYRSMDDVVDLLPLQPNIRLCKGAYKEPGDVAFPAKADVDRNYIALLEKLLLRGGYTGIATHDEAIIRHAKRFIRENHIAQDRFEFQMLYGVWRELQSAIAREGSKMRVYVPYGSQWCPYFMRRMAERPANFWFVVKNLFRG
jgi:proline dehydrogenase